MATGAQHATRPVVAPADDGQSASDVARTWLTGQRREGWARLRGQSRRALAEELIAPVPSPPRVGDE